MTGRTGRIDKGRNHYYELDGERVPTVTQITGYAPKGNLDNWKLKIAGECALDALTRPDSNDARVVSELLNAGANEEARKYISQASSRVSTKSADMGTHVHKLTEVYPETVECPPGVCEGECLKYMDQYQRFLDDYQPEFLLREVTVFSRSYKYAGTFDWLARIGGVTGVGDTKTGSGIYPEVGPQIAAYRHADFYLEEGQEKKLPLTSGGWVLHLRPDTYELRSVRCDGETFSRFRYFQVVHQWDKEFSKSIIGDVVPTPVLSSAHGDGGEAA